MSLLTVQCDVRLRRLTPEGLEDCLVTFTHYDLPPDAAAGDWSPGTRLAHEGKAWEWLVNHIGQVLPEIFDACQWEQPELPFG